MLNDPAAIGDELLFATVVILRLLEELQGRYALPQTDILN